MIYILNVMQGLGLLLFAPMVAGIIKKAKARLQNRRGPSIFQVYYDIYKLLNKDSIISPTTTWLFKAAPVIYFSAAFAAACLLPFVRVSNNYSDLFVLIYLFALGRFFLAIASLDAGSTFGGMGGSREMYVSVLIEPAMLFAMLTMAMKAQGTGLAQMVYTAQSSSISLSMILAAAGFFMVMIAETGRIPVDNPDTHLELTMIHEGMTLEYSGKQLALIHLASTLKQLIIIVLFCILFLPYEWNMVVKVIAAALSIAIAETSTNKMRLFRVPSYLAISCLLSVLALAAQ